LKYDFETKQFLPVKWKDVLVGSVVKVLKNEVVPADMLVIKSSAENGFCYLQTTNLDGESALKARETLVIFHDLLKGDQDSMLNENLEGGSFEVDPPDNNIYSVSGAVHLKNFEKCHFDINNIILRGGSLKNVDFVYGLVVYTGKETKIMKNIQGGSVKMSSIDTQLNKIVVYIILVTFLVCIICTILGIIFWQRNRPSDKSINMDYVFYQSSNTTTSSEDTSEIFKTFGSFFTIFNTLIPISLMITMQVVKGMQIIVMEKDPHLREKPDEKSKILSMNLQEDLGNVRYIFTDKTGTLTRNEMEFKACTIFTKLFDEELSAPADSETEVASSRELKDKSIFAKTFDTRNLREALIHEHPVELASVNSPFNSMKDAVMEFFLNIALNHNVLTEVDQNTGKKSYTGSNPDEVVLVQAAKEMGIEFLERAGKYSKVKVFNEILTFEVLYRFEYSSARMRSSIVVKDPIGVIKIYMKGADSIILKKIDRFSENFVFQITKDHLDKFGKEGLRTLCYSMKILDEIKLKEWEIGYKIVQTQAMADKSKIKDLEDIIGNLESSMLLVGVSGLEDKLQDDVKDTLKELIEAGIHVWMLTGDKLDTAESIGYSCKLFNDDTEVFKIKAGGDKEATLQMVRKIYEDMKIMEDELLRFKIEKKKKKKMKRKMLPQPIQRNSQEGDIIVLNQNASHYQKRGSYNFIEQPTSTVINPSNRKTFKRTHTPQNLISPNKPFLQSDMNFFPAGRVYKSTGKNALHLRKTESNFKQRPTSGMIYNAKGQMMDLNELTNNVASNHLRFVRGDLDRKSNMITLNFMKSELSANRSRPSSGHSKMTRNKMPTQSNPSLKRYPSINQNYRGEEENSGDEIDDVDIIKFMVDKNFFEDNLFGGLGKRNLSFLNEMLRVKEDIDEEVGNEISLTTESSEEEQSSSSSSRLPTVEVINVNKAENNFMETVQPIKPIMPKKIKEDDYDNDDKFINESFSDDSEYADDFNARIERLTATAFNKTSQSKTDNKSNTVNTNTNIKPKQTTTIIGTNPVSKEVNKEVKKIKDTPTPLLNDFKEEEPKLKPIKAAGYAISPDLRISKEVNPLSKSQKSKASNRKNSSKNPFLQGTYKAFKHDVKEQKEADNYNLQNYIIKYKNQIKELAPRRKYDILGNFDFFTKSQAEDIENRDISMMNFGLIVEGSAISLCLEDDIGEIFWECLKKSRSIVCCRCAPIQKSQVVHFIKKKSNQVTLAIGDGGNDVNMIKAANVGVGIFGKEGYQAAFNSDYAVSQFRYLKRLLFVHGRYSLMRNSYFIFIYFYKNLIFTFPQFWFAFFSGFSGSLLWDDWYYLGYNSFLTTVPPSCRMLFEEDIDIDFENHKEREKVSTLIPDIYKEYRDSKPFNVPKFFFVFLVSILHSLIIYFLPFLAFSYGLVDSTGKCVCMWDHSLNSFISVVVIQYWIIIEDSFLITPYILGVHGLQIILYIVFVFVQNIRDAGQVSGIFFDIVGNIQFWLTMIITCYVTLIIFIVSRRLEVLFSDTIINNIRHNNYSDNYERKEFKDKLTEVQKYSRSLAKFKKIMKKDEEYEPQNLAEKKIKSMVDTFKSSTNILKESRSKSPEKQQPKKKVSDRYNNDENIQITENDEDLLCSPAKLQSIKQMRKSKQPEQNFLQYQQYQNNLASLDLNRFSSVPVNGNFMSLDYDDTKFPTKNQPQIISTLEKPKKVDKISSKVITHDPSVFFNTNPAHDKDNVIEDIDHSPPRNTKSNKHITFKETNNTKTNKEVPTNRDPLIHDYPLEITQMLDEDDIINLKK
jgi:magnesium-transporting ATPase (P-type)